MPGFLANLIIDVEDRVGAVTLANVTSGLSGTLHLDLIDILTELEPAIPMEWRPAEVPAEVLEIVGPWYWGPRPHVLRAEGADLLHLETPDGARMSRFRPADDGTWRGLDGYFAGETLTLVPQDGGSVSHLDVGTFCFTRSPYDPEAPIPGGLPEEGWHTPPDPSKLGNRERPLPNADPSWDS